MNAILKRINSVIIVASVLLSISAPVMAAEFNKKPLNPDTSDWIVYENPNPDLAEDTPLDASDFLDAPAGKHGFIVDNTNNSEKDFIFEDGTRIQFIGTNIHRQECVMDYDELIDLAKSMAQSGINMVRIFFDDDYSKSGLWGRKGDNGPIFEPDQMDKFFFLLNEFKKRGIYINLQFTYGASTTADSNVDIKYDISEYAAFFDPEIIQCQKDFIEMFMTQYNPYAGMKLKDDPSIAAILLRNETNLVCLNFSKLKTGYYAQELEKMFNDWVCENYGTTKAELESAWAAQSGEKSSYVALDSDEDPAKKNLNLFHVSYNMKHDSDYHYTAKRRIAQLKFLEEVQTDYYNDLASFLKNDLGVKCAISATSTAKVDASQKLTLKTNGATDFLDNHNYFSSISPYAPNYQAGIVRSHAMDSLLMDTFYPAGQKSLSIIGEELALAVYGAPTIISEWNETYHNLYTAEQLLMMISYSALNGAHPLGFAWIGSDLTNDKKTFGFNNPDYWAALPTVGRMFLRQDITQADRGYTYLRMNGDMPYASEQAMHWIYPPMNIALIGKSGVAYDDIAYNPDGNDQEVLLRAMNAKTYNTPFVSITNQMSTDFDNKVFKLNTDRTQAVSAFFQPTSGGTREIELSDVKFKLDNEYVTAYLTSLSDEAIYQTDSMLLTLVGEARNTGFEVDDDGKTVLDGGTGPVLCEPVSGTVTIKTTDTLRVYPLNTHGVRMTGKSFDVTPVGGMAVINLSRSTGAMHYEIVKATHNDVKPTAVDLGDEVVDNAVFDDLDGVAQKSMIEELALRGIFERGGNFNPTSSITKTEFADWLYKALFTNGCDTIDSGNTSLEKLANAGVTDSSSGSSAIVRSDAMVMMSKAIDRSLWRKEPGKYDVNGTSASSCSDYTVSFSLSNAYYTYNKYKDDKEYWDRMFAFGIFKAKDGKVAYGDNLTRAEAAEAIYRYMWSKSL